jgi:hypothetical protein
MVLILAFLASFFAGLLILGTQSDVITPALGIRVAEPAVLVAGH